VLPGAEGRAQRHEARLEASHGRVPQGAVRGPVPFNLIANDLGDGTERALGEGAGETAERGAGHTR